MIEALDQAILGQLGLLYTSKVCLYMKKKKKKKNVYFDRMFLVRRPTIKAYNEATSMQVT